jgi:hypothetical protein
MDNVLVAKAAEEGSFAEAGGFSVDLAASASLARMIP